MSRASLIIESIFDSLFGVQISDLWKIFEELLSRFMILFKPLATWQLLHDWDWNWKRSRRRRVYYWSHKIISFHIRRNSVAVSKKTKKNVGKVFHSQSFIHSILRVSLAKTRFLYNVVLSMKPGKLEKWGQSFFFIIEVVFFPTKQNGLRDGSLICKNNFFIITLIDGWKVAKWNFIHFTFKRIGFWLFIYMNWFGAISIWGLQCFKTFNWEALCYEESKGIKVKKWIEYYLRRTKVSLTWRGIWNDALVEHIVGIWVSNNGRRWS